MNPDLNLNDTSSTNILIKPWRHWETRRLIYNGALALVALTWLVLTWPHFRPAFNIRAGTALLVLALLANVLYSAVYVVEFLADLLPAPLARLHWRGIAWALGTMLALAMEMYWIADEIYPHPQGP